MPTVYAAMRDRLLIVEGAPPGGGWTASERLSGEQLECVAAGDDRPERVFVGTLGDGLYRSTDAGETFEQVGGDELEPKVMSLAISPHDPAVVWAGTEPSRVYRSADGGRTWEERPGLTDLPSADEWYFPPRPETHHVRWIEPDPHVEGRLYVGIEAGALVVTDDGGATWRERPEGSRRDNHSMAIHPDAPGRVYAAAGDGYAESTDAGETWVHPQEGLSHRYCWSVVPDPGDPDRVLMSAASGAGAAHSAPAESYVYRRVDGGDPTEGRTGRGSAATDDPFGAWERLDDRGLPTGEGILRAVLAAAGPGEFYAVNNRGIFRSTDGGDSWGEVPIEWPDDLAERTCRGVAVV